MLLLFLLIFLFSFLGEIDFFFLLEKATYIHKTKSKHERNFLHSKNLVYIIEIRSFSVFLPRKKKKKNFI